jgi:hypothetical protein
LVYIFIGVLGGSRSSVSAVCCVHSEQWQQVAGAGLF